MTEQQTAEYDRIMAVLTEHRWTIRPYHHPGHAVCSCGWKQYVPFGDDKHLAHMRHVAGVLVNSPREK